MLKKPIPYAALLAAAISCSTISLVMNSTDDKGVRKMLTSDVNLFDEFDAALGCKIENRDTIFSVLVTCTKKASHGIFKKNDRITLTLDDGARVELHNIYNHKFESDTVSNEAANRSNVEMAYNTILENPGLEIHALDALIPKNLPEKEIRNRSYALYPIGKKQLKAIMDKGVKSLSIQAGDNSFDMDDASDVADRFKDMYSCLKENR